MIVRGQETRPNFLVFSDVHLGADLVQHARPWTVARLRQAARVDRDLASMLDHYREARDPDRPWTLVIAGDLVDFIGMSIAPNVEGLESPPTEEEHEHGMGSGADRSAAKMRAVVHRHTLVFEKLARFVADGHRLVLVRGNHDVEFHWERAREVFVAALVERAFGEESASVDERQAYEARIEFSPWFYYVEGLLYVEHGHQYDEMCSYSNQLVPTSPSNPRTIGYSFADVLVRMVVQPTPVLGSDGHEHYTPVDYVRLAFSMGLRGAWKLGVRFARALMHLFASWRAEIGEHTAAFREEHERRLEEMSTRLRLGREKLRALADLSVPPVTRRLLGILRGLFLDQIGAAAIGLVLLALAFWLMPIEYASAALLPVVGGFAAVNWSSRRGRVLDPSAILRARAARIVELFPAQWIVMGHTHSPVMSKVSPASTYINLGAWASDELDGVERAAQRTHLVIRHENGEPRAQFFTWDPERGASPWSAV